jgi:hypothetical protein
MRSLFLFSWLALLSSACQNTPKEGQTSTTIANPEMTVRQWQKYIDNNDFKNAQALSTTDTRQWLEGIEAAFSEDTLKMKTNFEQITCQEEAEKAMCVCRIKQNITDESYEDVFFLVKENGKWVIDLNNEDEPQNDFFEPITADTLQKKAK